MKRIDEEKLLRQFAGEAVKQEIEWISGLDINPVLPNTLNNRMEWILDRHRRRVRREKTIRMMVSSAATIAILLLISNSSKVVDAGQAILKWGASMVDIRYKTDIEEYNGIPEYELTYLPEGVEQADSYYNDQTGGGGVYQSDTLEFFFDYGYSDSMVSVNDEYVEKKQLTLGNSMKVMYLESKKEGYNSSLIWLSEDEKFSYILTGNLSKEEFLRVFAGIREK